MFNNNSGETQTGVVVSTTRNKLFLSQTEMFVIPIEISESKENYCVLQLNVNITFKRE